MPEEGLSLFGMAEGRYRLIVLDAYAGSGVLNSFEVAGLDTRVDVAVERPRRVELRLAVFEPGGRRVRDLELCEREESSWTEGSVRPRWKVRPRAACFSYELESAASGGGTRTSTNCFWTRARADLDGWLDLGERRGSALEISRRLHVALRLPGLEVPSDLRLSPDRERRPFVTLALDPALVHESLFLPGGRDGRAFASDVHLKIGALPTAPGREEADAREVPVEVWVKVAGHERLEFAFTVGELPLWARYLVAEGAAEDR